jgi:hypothetical protein
VAEECQFAEVTRCVFRLADQLSEPNIGFDEVAAAACVQDVESAVAQCSAEELEMAELANCRGMFSGVLQEGETCQSARADGEECTDDYECMAGNCDYVDGVCAPVEFCEYFG